MKLVFLGLFLSLSVQAASIRLPFRCGQFLVDIGGLDTSTFRSQSEVPDLEMALSVAFFAISQVDQSLAVRFKNTVLATLAPVSVVQRPPSWTRFLGARQTYAARSRLPISDKRTVVWTLKSMRSMGDWMRQAMLAANLVFEVKSLQQLPPNFVRVTRFFNPMLPDFLENASASLFFQSLIYRGFLRMEGVPLTELDLFPKQTAWFLVRARGKTHPYFGQTLYTREIHNNFGECGEHGFRFGVQGYLADQYGEAYLWDYRSAGVGSALFYTSTLVLGLLTWDALALVDGISLPEAREVNFQQVKPQTLDEARDWDQRSEEQLIRDLQTPDSNGVGY